MAWSCVQVSTLGAFYWLALILWGKAGTAASGNDAKSDIRVRMPGGGMTAATLSGVVLGNRNGRRFSLHVSTLCSINALLRCDAGHSAASGQSMPLAL